MRWSLHTCSLVRSALVEGWVWRPTAVRLELPTPLRLTVADVQAALVECPAVRLPAEGVTITLPCPVDPHVVVSHHGRPMMRLQPVRKVGHQAALKLPG